MEWNVTLGLWLSWCDRQGNGGIFLILQLIIIFSSWAWIMRWCKGAAKYPPVAKWSFSLPIIRYGQQTPFIMSFSIRLCCYFWKNNTVQDKAPTASSHAEKMSQFFVEAPIDTKMISGCMSRVRDNSFHIIRGVMQICRPVGINFQTQDGIVSLQLTCRRFCMNIQTMISAKVFNLPPLLTSFRDKFHHLHPA